MTKRLLDILAPVKPVGDGDRGYRRLLRWAAIPVTDRRWAAPLAAVALGFGLFAGVAIGPGAAGTLATAPYQLIEMPGLGGGGDESEGGEEGEEEPFGSAAPEASGGFGGEEESPGIVPVVPFPEEPLEPGGEEELPSKGPEPKEEEKPEAQELVGTVVHVNPAASSYTVAEEGGVMSAVHSGKLPPAGAQIEVPIRTLANGTLAEAGKRKTTASKKRATLAGIVTFVDADLAAPSYAVSNKGTSLLVKIQPDPAAAVPPLPVLGAYASVTVSIEAPKPASASAALPEEGQSETPPSGETPPESVPPPVVAPPAPAPAAAPAVPTDGCVPDPTVSPPPPVAPKGTLWQGQLSGGGAPFTHSDFEGIVEAVCPATAQLLVSADDIRESGHDLLFAVPAGIDTSKLVVGDSILASADIGADGTLALTGLASDARLKGAEDAEAVQGDLVAKKAKG